jgi:hypothetical protein
MKLAVQVLQVHEILGLDFGFGPIEYHRVVFNGKTFWVQDLDQKRKDKVSATVVDKKAKPLNKALLGKRSDFKNVKPAKMNQKQELELV